MAPCASRLAAVLALFAIVMMSSPVQAKTQSLFVHYNSEAFEYWLADNATDANATSASAGYNPLVMAAFAINELPIVGDPDAQDEPVAATWLIPLQPNLTAPIDLDPERPIEFNIFLAPRSARVEGQSVPGVASIEVVSQLMQNETLVASASTNKTLGPTANFTLLNLSAPAAVTRLDPADGNLLWRLRAKGPATGYILGLSNETGHTNLTVPLVVPPAPAAIVEAEEPVESVAEEDVPSRTETRTLTATQTVTQTVTVGYTFKLDRKSVV